RRPPKTGYAGFAGQDATDARGIWPILRSTICGLRRLREGLPSLGLLTLSSTRPSSIRFLPESARAQRMSRTLANHSVMLCGAGNLARRRIEQHAYIPYTHGCRHVCDRL